VPLCVATVAALLYGLANGSGLIATAHRLAGATWSTLSIVAVLLSCTWGGREFGWIRYAILGLIGLISLALVSGLLLVRAEMTAADPLIPGHAHRATRALSWSRPWQQHGLVWTDSAGATALAAGASASATEAGALLTPGIVLGPLSSVAAGQIMARTGSIG